MSTESAEKDAINALLRADAVAIIEAAINAVSPSVCMPRNLRLEGSILLAGNGSGPVLYDLNKFRRILLLGAGKASVAMAMTTAQILGPGRISHGIIVTKYGHAGLAGENLPKHIEVIEAAHPEPDIQGLRGCIKVHDLLQSSGSNDLVIALLSGGGSALWPLPARGISIDEKAEISRILLSCGATIHEINAIRKHLSAIKGGLAARLAHPSHVLVFAISDVIGDDLSAIASGPFAPDPTTFEDAWRIIHRYRIEQKIPRSIYEHLRRGIMGDIGETPKPDEIELFRRVRHVICASNRQALEAARQKAETLGYSALIMSSELAGDVLEAGTWLAQKIREKAAGERHGRLCLISGGEPTVKLSESHGIGGRNQELAMIIAREIIGMKNAAFVSCATDGTDGPTDAAGAIVFGDTAERMAVQGSCMDQALQRHDTYPCFKQLGDLIQTGPTGTNVMDLQLFLLAR